MSQKLKRTSTNARRAVAAQAKARRARVARARTGSAVDAVMAMVPFSDETLHRIFLAIIMAAALALAWILASIAGVPAMASEQVANLATQAGFTVSRVEVRGTAHVNELVIYQRVLAQRDRAMPLVDLAAIRQDLLTLPWVADARVSRQLPDTLVVDIVERKPKAALRIPSERGDRGDRLMLIDAAGTPIDEVSREQTRGLLVLSGDGAGQRMDDLAALFDTAPALKAQVVEADWVGHRRWDLVFGSGQRLMLPEGDDVSRKALLRFARLDGINTLIGGPAQYFDMRVYDPDANVKTIFAGLGDPAGDKPASAAAMAKPAVVGASLAAAAVAAPVLVRPAAAKPEHAKPDHAKAEQAKVDHKPADRAKAEHAKAEHVKLDHKPTDHKQADHPKVDHKQSDHAKSDHVKATHAKPDQAKSDHVKADHAKGDHAKADHKPATHAKAGHKTAEHKQADHKPAHDKPHHATSEGRR